MLVKEAYLDRVVGEVEDLAARVALLKGRFAKQKVSVKLEQSVEVAWKDLIHAVEMALLP
jgi:hypothetical protein